MGFTDILTQFGVPGLVGAIAMKLIDLYVLPKKDKKDFDTKLRDELWTRINQLEGQLNEQNKMIVQIIRENAKLSLENENLKEELKLK